MILLLPRLLTVTLAVSYYRLDYPSILQDFVWQLDDRTPDFPRVHKFLDHWRREIEAVIAEVQISTHDGADWRRIDEWRY